jgi:hypothetical protein
VNVLFIFMVVVAVKLPVLWCVWYIFKTIHDVPAPEIERGGGDFVRAEFEPGPRVRGPHGGEPLVSGNHRRGDKGHDEIAPYPNVTIDA